MIKLTKSNSPDNARHQFTVEDGIKTQATQLARWEKVLKPELFTMLRDFVVRDNYKAKTGYDVMRGNDIDMVVHNVLMNL